MRLKWKLVSIHLVIVLILTQDRCTVCAEHTIGSKIGLYALDGLLGDVGQVVCRFDLFGDSVFVGVRTWEGPKPTSEFVLRVP
jgi:hypothetical protein